MRKLSKILASVLLCLVSLFSHAQDKVDTASGRSLMQSLQLTDQLKIKPAGLVQKPFDSLVSKALFFYKAKPFVVNTVEVQASSQQISPSATYPGVANNSMIFGYRLHNSISIFSVPFDFAVNGNNGYYFFQRSPFDNFYKLNFDPKKYQELLRTQVLNTINPDLLAASVVKRIDEIKTGYERRLKTEISGIQQQFEAAFKQELHIPAELGDLSRNDLSGLRAALFQNDSLLSNNLSNVLQPDISGAMQDSVSLKRALVNTHKLDALNEILNRFTYYKQLFEGNSAVNELRSQLPFNPGNFRSYLNNPGHLRETIKEHASLSSFQNLFLNLTHLNLGQNAVQKGNLDLENIVNSGVNAGFTNGKSSVDIINGKSANTNQWLQSGLTSFITNEYTSLTGVKFSPLSSNRLRQSVSINFFNFQSNASDFERQELSQNYYFAAPRHKDAVITLESEYALFAGSRLKLDVSKSFGSYSSTAQGAAQPAKEGSFTSLFGNKEESSLAFLVNYNTNILKIPVQLDFKRVGLGYSNPGNVSLRRGETEIGVHTNGRYLHNKLRLMLASSYRNQHFDPLKKYLYRTFSNKIQTDYRWRKNNHLGLTWQENDYLMSYPNTAKSGGRNNRFEFNSVNSFFLWGKKIQSAFIISNQHTELPFVSGENYRSNNWLFSENTSLLLGKNLLTASVMRNASSNKDYYYNTSFTSSELHYSYRILDQLELTNSVGYYQNEGWNKQLGIQQQISGVFLKKIDFELQVNYKKAIQVIRKEMANELFVSSSLYYHFN